MSVPFDATGLPLLTEALLEEGFPPDEIEQIMGESVVRVLRRTLPPAEENGQKTGGSAPVSGT